MDENALAAVNSRHRESKPRDKDEGGRFGRGASLSGGASRRRRRNRPGTVSLILLVMAAWSGGGVAAAAQAGGNGIHSWTRYLGQLQNTAQNSAAVRSAEAGIKASQGTVAAQTGDRGLKFSASYTDYPNGGGTGANGSFTDLQQRGEARIGWDLLDFLGRRPGRIASARAQVGAAKAGLADASVTFQLTLLDRSVAKWTSARRRSALQHARSDLQMANQSLQSLRGKSLSARLATAVTEASQQVLSLETQVNQTLASLPEPGAQLPLPPDSYWLLPMDPPSEQEIELAAKKSQRAAQLNQQARAYDDQSDANWAHGAHFNVYAGYVEDKLRSTSSFEHGPEIGAELTVPIGGGGGGRQTNAHWQAVQQRLAAQAAVEEQLQALRKLREQWAEASSAVSGGASALKQQAGWLHRMDLQSKAGAGTNAPEPWQVRLQAARFWMSVADLWQSRGRWVKSVLTWSLYDKAYLRNHMRVGSAPASSGLCSPLSSCPQI